jgi:CHAD domain-containing protein
MMISASRSDEEFSKEVIAQQVDALLKEIVSLKNHPCEKSIHDTRVQSRRVRAALEAFGDLCNSGPYRAFYRSIKELTQALGKPRELSIILLLLRDLHNTGDAAEGLCREYLARRMENRLRKQENQLLRSLNAIDPLRPKSQIQFLLAGMDSHAAGNESTTVQTGRPFQQSLLQMCDTDRERAQRIFKELAQPLLTFQPRHHFHRATDDTLHKLRISAKRLRYAMELFAPLWPSGLKDEIKVARALQDAGGQYHDWCVLCENLKAEIRCLHKGDTGHMAFQIGRLLAAAEDRRGELRKPTLPAIKNLQSTLRRLLLQHLGNQREHKWLIPARGDRNKNMSWQKPREGFSPQIRRSHLVTGRT